MSGTYVVPMYQVRRVGCIEIAVSPLHLIQAVDFLRSNRTTLAPSLSGTVIIVIWSVDHVGIVRQNRTMLLPLNKILRCRHAKLRLATIEAGVGHVECPVNTNEPWIFRSISFVRLGREENGLVVTSKIVAIVGPSETNAGYQTLILSAVKQENLVVDYGCCWVEKVHGFPTVVRRAHCTSSAAVRECGNGRETDWVVLVLRPSKYWKIWNLVIPVALCRIARDVWVGTGAIVVEMARVELGKRRRDAGEE